MDMKILEEIARTKQQLDQLKLKSEQELARIKKQLTLSETAIRFDNLANGIEFGKVLINDMDEGSIIRTSRTAEDLAPVVAGLYYTNDFLGYYDGTDPYSTDGWNAYLGSDGTFKFEGDGSNYISWDGATLDVRGAINADDITAGTLTGRTLQTDIGAAGHYERFVVSAVDNNAHFYDSSNNEIVTIGGNIYGGYPGLAIQSGMIYIDTDLSGTVIHAQNTYVGAVDNTVIVGAISDTTGSNAKNRCGVQGSATCSGLSTAIGVWGWAAGGAANWAGYFDLGDVYIANNLGIGTTSPDNPFELLSATTPQIRITNTDATDYATFAVDTDGQLDITTVDGGGAGGHICLMPDGNVGIGTTEPDTNLMIYGSSGNVRAKVKRGNNTQQIAYVIEPNGAFTPTNVVWFTGMVGSSNDYRIWNWDGTTSNYPVTILNNGHVGIGNTSPTALLDINSDILRLRTAKTPASAGAAGNAGDICWDADYIYVCTATNTWERVALASW